MDPLEVLVFVLALVALVPTLASTGNFGTHHLFYRGNPWPGLVRLSVVAGMLWTWVVILVWADASVRGFYVIFYLVLGYFAIKVFGQIGGALFGLRYRVDVVERRNGAVAIVLSAFTLATGMIFGGSLWGDADPVGDDEGGWWIVGVFFILGWLALCTAFAFYLVRERRRRGRTVLPPRQEMEPHRVPFLSGIDDPRPAAFFLLASGVTLTDAVSGDFWGWRHGLLTFGVLAGLLLVHEISASAVGRRAETGSRGGLRLVESALYMALAFGAVTLNRWFDLVLTTG